MINDVMALLPSSFYVHNLLEILFGYLGTVVIKNGIIRVVNWLRKPGPGEHCG